MQIPRADVSQRVPKNTLYHVTHSMEKLLLCILNPIHPIHL